MLLPYECPVQSTGWNLQQSCNLNREHWKLGSLTDQQAYSGDQHIRGNASTYFGPVLRKHLNWYLASVEGTPGLVLGWRYLERKLAKCWENAPDDIGQCHKMSGLNSGLCWGSVQSKGVFGLRLDQHWGSTWAKIRGAFGHSLRQHWRSVKEVGRLKLG